MSHTQTVTVEVPVTLKCEVELTWNGADGKWESDIIAIEGIDAMSHGAAFNLSCAIETKLQTSAHDIAVSQLP